MNIYDIPGNERDMDEIYVVLSKDAKGEGIVSMMGPIGAMPLVFGSKRLLDQVKPAVNKIAKESGQTLRICKFKKSEILEEIKGDN